MSKELPKNDIPSSLEDFKNKNPISLVQLPSGLYARLRKPSILRILRNGNLPSTLIELIQSGQVQTTDITKVSADKLQDTFLLMDLMLIDAFAEPELSIETVDVLTEEDRTFLFNWINTGVESLKKFRDSTEESGDVGSDSTEIQDKAE